MIRTQVFINAEEDELVVELLQDGSEWGEVAWSRETGRTELRIYLEPGRMLHLDFDEVVSALHQALSALGPKDDD